MEDGQLATETQTGIPVLRLTEQVAGLDDDALRAAVGDRFLMRLDVVLLTGNPLDQIRSTVQLSGGGAGGTAQWLVHILEPDGKTEPRFFRIGRAPDNDVVIADPTVSKLHAMILRGADGRYKLKDVGSSTGTWLDDEKLAARVSSDITPGQTIRLGNVSVQLLDANGLRPMLGAGA